MPKYDELYKQVADALRHTYPQTHAEELLQVFNEAIDLAESSDYLPAQKSELVADNYKGEPKYICSKCGALIGTLAHISNRPHNKAVRYCYHCGAKLILPDKISNSVVGTAEMFQRQFGTVPDRNCHCACVTSTGKCRLDCWITYIRKQLAQEERKDAR